MYTIKIKVKLTTAHCWHYMQGAAEFEFQFEIYLVNISLHYFNF